MDSLGFETVVEFEGKNRYLRDLKVGDKFTYKGEQRELTVKKQELCQCLDGARVRWNNLWWRVQLQGNINLIFPLTDQSNPFSAPQSKSRDFPVPTEDVEVLTLKELVGA